MDLENGKISKRRIRNDKSSKYKRVTRSGRTTKTPNKSPANIRASSSTRVPPKTDLTSRFGNAAGNSKNRDSKFLKNSDSSRIIPERTTDSLQKILETLLLLKQQNSEIIKNQKQLKLQIDNIEEKFGQKGLSEAQLLTDTLYQPLKGFPLSTIEQFKEMESDEQKNTREKLYQHVLYLGGSNPRKFLHGALKVVMTDKLVCEFSWLGDKRSEKFGNTKISNVLFQAVKSCPLFNGPETKAEYKKEIQEILRCTKQRYRNQLKKFDVPETEGSDTDREIDTMVTVKRYLDSEESSRDEDFEEEECSSSSFSSIRYPLQPGLNASTKEEDPLNEEFNAGEGS